METNFPTDTGYQGFFLVGYRKDPAGSGAVQRTGTVLLKRAYTIASSASDPAQGHITPVAALPVYVADIPNNLVRNGDFEATQKAFGEAPSDSVPPKPAAWTAETGASIQLAAGMGRTGSADTALRVAGSASARVVQVVAVDSPLSGRTFAFSLYASADAAASIAAVQLEAQGSSPICVINRNLSTSMARFSATGTWPAGLAATEMTVVLRMATDASRIVFYDDVQVEERSFVTGPPVTALRYESDMAAHKSEGDIIILGFSGSMGVGAVRVDSQTWLQRNLAPFSPDLFGWEPRSTDPRKGEAPFPADPGAYPLDPPLPGGFLNRYYNGYLRGAAQLAALPYLPAAAAVRIERDGTLYAFTIGGETVTASYHYYRGVGPDDDCAWRRQNIPIYRDTLVVEPDANRCYLVWRGAWPLDEQPDSVYRRLVVTATG